MASLYKKSIAFTDQKTREKVKRNSKKWWGRYRSADGRERRVPLAADKAAAQAMLNELVRKAEREMAGLVEPFDEQRKRPLREHLTDYEKYLRDRGTTENYVNTTVQRVRDLLTGCRFIYVGDISASRVQGFLADLRSSGRSIETSNHYLRALKMFVRWMVKDRRTNDNPVSHLSSMNADTDRRRVRRPLSAGEFDVLLQSAAEGPPIQHVSGPDRVVLYIVACYTGYRRNEIGSVHPGSFDFDSDPPTLTVRAGYSKRRRDDVIPLRKDFSEIICQWLASKADIDSAKPLFDITGKRTAEMIRKDLERVGIPYVDQNGHYADFHALRKTFISNLSKAGVSPKTAQVLARHSDINLTMNTYTTLGLHDQVAGVEALPPIPADRPAKETQELKSTGTVGTQVVPTMVPSGAENGAEQVASRRQRITRSCTQSDLQHDESDGAEQSENPEKNSRSCAALHQPASPDSRVRERGLEPPRPFGHWILNPARLPIPPLSLRRCDTSLRQIARR